jgi:hypothetical protein
LGFVFECDAVGRSIFESTIESVVERNVEFVAAVPFAGGAFASGIKVRLEEMSVIAVKAGGVGEEILDAKRVERIPAGVMLAFDQDGLRLAG